MEGGGVGGEGGGGGGEEGAAESKRRRGKSGPSTYHRLEDQINLQHLEELMEVFHKADENGSDGLDIDEFKSAFGEILGQGKSDQQMAIMFMKIDTNCDGTVDWDEFCTYMLLEYQEKDSMTRGGRMPYPHPLRTVTREVLSAVRHMPTVPQTAADHSVAVVSDGGRYITAGQDGCVCVWKSNLSLTRTIQLEPVRQKTILVTDLVPLPNVNKFVAASTENVLICYDLSAASDPQQVITGFPHSVVAMDYWYSMKDPNQSVLLLGDTGGRVTVLEFSKASQGLFLSQDGSKQECSSLTFDELLMGRVEGVRMRRFAKLHNEWVQCVRYCPSLEGLFSASTDPKAPLVLADVRGKSCLGKSVFRIDKGVNSFDYSEAWNVIATGGLDSIVRLWNPYVPAKPTATLQGHTTAILFIAIADTHNHLLSFSKDKELRVWDLQDQGCLQVLQCFGKLGTQVPYAYCLNRHNSLLLLATNQLGVLEPSSGGEFFGCRDICSHSKPLCAALYNANFNQVVSGCHGGTVSVWDVDTGSKIMQFSQAHGEAEITAMSFDPSGRRLITGGRDGTIKIWNFNNGACLSVLHNEDTAEVTSVVCLKQRIVVGGWNRRLAMYSDTRGSRAAVPKYWAERAHCEDILCMAHSPPNLLVSASYDGDIILWNADCERKLCRMNAKSYLHQQPQPGGEGEGEGSSGSVCTEESRGQAVEQMLLLLSRDPLPTAATLVTCGEGGWVRFWSVYGLGLAGEFPVFSPGEGCGMESVTSCCTTSTNHILFTGDSSGYVKAWDIERYCLEVHPEICRDAPPLLLSFRAHVKNIVSLCVAEGRGLLVSASTDCCVRLWTVQGRFIGTFGEKWHLSYPLQTSQLPHRVPPDISNSASFNTLNVTSGPPTSKWILARNLFRALRRQVMGPSAPDAEGCAARLAEEDGEEIKRRVLGRFYKRKTRPRQLLQPMKVQQSGHHVLPFTTLQCSELRQTEEFHLPPIRQSHHHGNSSNHDSDAEGSPSRPKVLTLVDVLPEIAHREATSGAKSSAGWPLHQAPLPTAHASRALRRNGMPAM